MKYSITRSAEFQVIAPQFKGLALTADITNTPASAALWDEIRAVVADFRSRFTTDSIKFLSGIEATRAAYKAAGKDPSRYRPACEQLARRVVQGKDLYAINTVVDLVNLVSLQSHYSTAALDADAVEGTAIELGLGRPDEPYEAIGRGPLNIDRLPVYRDATGAFATPTSDSTRTMTGLGCRHLLMLVNGYDGSDERLAEALQLTVRLLTQYAEARNVEHIYY